jgi:hypothetical protein
VAINIHEQSCVQRDILSAHTGTAMQQTVGRNHLSTWVAQDGEPSVHNAVPHKERVLAVVNADGYKTGVEGVELFRMPRELAQLARAVRSPVTPIENQEHASATHWRKTNGLAVLVLECKVWRRFALSGSDLGPRQDLLRDSKN